MLRDINLTGYDLIRVRLLNPPGKFDAMPLQYAVERYTAARNMLQAAACSAARPQQAYLTPEAIPSRRVYEAGQTGTG